MQLTWLLVAYAAPSLQLQRLYDLSERVIPGTCVATPQRPDAVRALVEMSAKALGVATYAHLRNYFRLGAKETRTAIDSLVSEGILVPVQVAHWSKPAYRYSSTKAPHRIKARALLSPFDSLIFERSRTQDLFGFTYRLEVYIPKAKRRYGYYVLPFLLGEKLVARVDLKADRKRGNLIVHGAFAEDHAPSETAFELAQELQLLAHWLGLPVMQIENHGNLADDIIRTLRT